MAGTSKEASQAGKTLSKLGASEGGKARAASLTPEERSEIARKAVQARWRKAGQGAGPDSEVVVLRATHGGSGRTLKIGDIEIPCYVLEDGRRVLSQKGMLRALGISRGGGGDRLGRFLSGNAISPFLAEGWQGGMQSISFLPPLGGGGGGMGYAYEATFLADICEAVLKARDSRKLSTQQAPIALRCEVLMRGFARVGIIALIDEATGYQEARAKDSLTKILEAFIAKELQAYVDVFPSGFYEQLFRLRGLAYPQDSVKRPQYFGILTNDIVYKRLAPGVLDELRRITPRRPTTGALKHRYYNKLTSNLGFPKLKEHLGAVVAIMRMSKNWGHFIENLDQLHPRYGDTRRLSFPDYDATQDSGTGL